ncbi:MAG: hypothetical protein NC485_09455 [Ruminococcus flavefaciens]|nr:hypothetical protein [Ruminococcus flavefaciens]MCM1062173.1 hypothetical protein [Eubacterium sp.]
MLNKIEYVFFDMEEPLVAFIVDYLTVMGMFAIIGYYMMVVLKIISKKRRSVSV